MKMDERLRKNIIVLRDGVKVGLGYGYFEIELLTEKGGRLWFTSIHNLGKKIRSH
jgi:hypothetical protein